MIKRKTPLKRTALKRSTKPLKRSPVVNRRTKPRRSQPSKEEKGIIRHRIYERSGGRCELNLSPLCIKGVLPENGETPYDHWHLVHLKAKRVHGWADENLKGGCHICHLIELHNPKSVPKK